MHPRLRSASKRLQHAQAIADANGDELAKLFLPNHPYRICFVRLSNKARYAAEIIEYYAHGVASDRELADDQIERVIETEKWFLIGVLSIIQYSMPSFLGNRGSPELKNLAQNGPFSKFLDRAESEKAIDPNEKGLLVFLSNIRNDLIHRNGVSKANAKIVFGETTFELIEDQMIEGHWGMLTELGTLAICSLESFIDCIEENLGAEEINR